MFPLAKEFSEGIGRDVIAYKDIDVANWTTASNVSGTITPWVISGAYKTGSIGDVADYYVSGNIGIGSQSLMCNQFFTAGNENLKIDITNLVSASIFGNLPNYGYRLSFSESEETDTQTRFVKRFGSRQTNDKKYHPEITVVWDGDVISDDSNLALFDLTNSFFVYNSPRGLNRNFYSGSVEITGSNCLKLDLIASKSVSYLTSSFSLSHSQSITYKTSSIFYFSSSFTGSQLSFGNLNQTGSYYSDIILDTMSDSTLFDFVDDTGFSIKFQTIWKSLDDSVVYSYGPWVKFNKFTTGDSSFDLRNYVTNIINLKEYYNCSEHSKFRIFIQDYNFEVFTSKLPKTSKSKIFKNMFWRIIDPYTKEIIIPFDSIGTKLSSDGDGMFFDFWFRDLDEGNVYEIELKIIEDDTVHLITNQGFIFKVVK